MRFSMPLLLLERPPVRPALPRALPAVTFDRLDGLVCVMQRLRSVTKRTAAAFCTPRG